MRMEELVGRLTLEEKAALLEGADSWYTNPVPRLGIPRLHLTDGPHGVRQVRRAGGGFSVSDNEPATAFPTSAAVASSWNPELARRMGEAIAEECLAAGVDVLLAPGINIKRSPLCGRNFEYYSEDPLVSAAFGAAFVQGVQSKGVGCCVKHFAVNSNETFRFVGDSVVDERALREIYLRAFESVVKNAKPYAVMSAYNKVNGTFASENRRLLTDILRREWGFDGVVMTDWGATCDRVEGLLAGCDLDMPGGSWHNRKAILEAARSGRLAADVLDASVRRMLRLIGRCRTGKAERQAAPDFEKHAALACDIAKESAVLLKNDGTLPLSGGERLLVVGEMFEKMRFQGAGSSLVHPTDVVTPKDAFDRRGISYAYEKGYRSFDPGRDERLEQAAVRAAEDADVILFFGGLTDFEESEGFDREHMRLGDNQTALLEKLAATGKKLVFVLFAGAPVELPFHDELSALLYMVLPGQRGGEAAAALLYGEAAPSGKLAESWPTRLEDTSCFADYNRGPVSRYYESIYVGYRAYDKAGTKLRFPFGFGLSYTTFAYAGMTVREEDGRVAVSADITNTGKRRGAEVVQLYVRHKASAVFRPDKELKAFAKVFLEPGETKRVELAFDKRDLAFWHAGLGRWVVENGTYELLLAASAADVRLAAELSVTDGETIGGTVPHPYPPDVADAYAMPPKDVPACFGRLAGRADAGNDPADGQAGGFHGETDKPRGKPDGSGGDGTGGNGPGGKADGRRRPSGRRRHPPLTMETQLRDFRRTFGGRIFYEMVMRSVRREYEAALAMPDSLERDSRLKNTHFFLRLMPLNTPRTMSMSSGGAFPYRVAEALVALANGQVLKGLSLLMKKEKPVPLPKDAK